MGLIIEKLKTGYAVTVHESCQPATAEHVANFILKYWPDVAEHIRARLLTKPPPSE